VVTGQICGIWAIMTHLQTYTLTGVTTAVRQQRNVDIDDHGPNE
jgi:hypothetical protein